MAKKQIDSLEAIDEAIFGKFLKAHKKTPLEFLYLETGALPLRWILAQRRFMFMKHMMDRHDKELIKKVFLAQKESPSQGDFVTLVTQDLLDLNMTLEEALCKNTTKVQLKKKIKNSAITAALKALKYKLSSHTKVKHIKYTSLQMQPYLKSPALTADEIHQLTSLRSQCVRGMRTHFKKMHTSLVCPLKCSPNAHYEDTPKHLLKCSKLVNQNAQYQDLNKVYSTIKEQEDIAVILSKLMREDKNT